MQQKLAIIIAAIIILVTAGIIVTTSVPQNFLSISSQTTPKKINISLSENIGISESKP